jgi:hypothetical protein
MNSSMTMICTGSNGTGSFNSTAASENDTSATFAARF